MKIKDFLDAKKGKAFFVQNKIIFKLVYGG